MSAALPMTDDYAQSLQGYIDGVLDGSIVCCKWVRLAVERHVRDLACQDDERGLFFDDQEAVEAIAFIESLRQSKGRWAGKPLILEPWQRFIVWNIFGWWRDRCSPRRRYKVVFVSVARKNGKSTLAAGIALLLGFGDSEPAAEVYSAATKRDQAKIVFEEASRMVRVSPNLKRRVEVRVNGLFEPRTNSSYKPLGADADSTDGLNPNGVIVDEVHAHKTRDLWDKLETATGARLSPMIFAITTAGDSGDQDCIYWELKAHTEKVLEQNADADDWFGIIYTLDGERQEGVSGKKIPGDDWQDESCWIKANPNLGVSVTAEELREKAGKATETPGALAAFQRYRLNTETESSSPWIMTGPGSDWAACAGGDFYGPRGIRPEVIETFRGRKCWVGGDLSSISDITALAFAFPAADGWVDLLCFGWCPRANVEGKDRDRQGSYQLWANQGYIKITEGNAVDYGALRSLLRKARDEWGWRIQQIAVDPNNALYFMTMLSTRMEEQGDGFEPEQVISHKQTCGDMNERIGATEKLILSRQLRHGGNPVLRWCVSNAITYTDAGGRRRFDKRARREKIDYAVASVMAVGLAAGQGMETDSVYEKRGILTV
jgi:phage terminase large subunit-like protein